MKQLTRLCLIAAVLGAVVVSDYLDVFAPRVPVRVRSSRRPGRGNVRQMRP